MIAGILCGAAVFIVGYAMGEIRCYLCAKKLFEDIINADIKRAENASKSKREFLEDLEIARVAIEKDSMRPTPNLDRILKN